MSANQKDIQEKQKQQQDKKPGQGTGTGSQDQKGRNPFQDQKDRGKNASYYK